LVAAFASRIEHCDRERGTGAAGTWAGVGNFLYGATPTDGGSMAIDKLNRRDVAACLAGTLLMPAIGRAFAQVPSTSPAPRPTETVNLTMEQRHIIREIVLKDLKTTPQAVEVDTSVGEVVPSSVLLQPVPVDVSAKVPQVRSHSFFVKDKAVIIVDPKDKRIAAVVD
jgi:hypothetical protein